MKTFHNNNSNILYKDIKFIYKDYWLFQYNLTEIHFRSSTASWNLFKLNKN